MNKVDIENPLPKKQLDGNDNPSLNRQFPSPTSPFSPSPSPSLQNFQVSNDHYVVLGLDFTTNPKEVTVKYRMLVRLYHQDK